MMPSFVLKRTVLQGFDTGKYENDIADSIDFMVERVSRNYTMATPVELSVT